MVMGTCVYDEKEGEGGTGFGRMAFLVVFSDLVLSKTHVDT